MKVIPSATVPSKLLSVSANTVPFRGWKSHSSNASLRAQWDHASGLQKHESIFLDTVMYTPRSHKNIHTTCTSQITPTRSAVASEGQRSIAGPTGPEPRRRLEEAAGHSPGLCSPPAQGSSGAAAVLQGSEVWTSQF